MEGMGDVLIQVFVTTLMKLNKPIITEVKPFLLCKYFLD